MRFHLHVDENEKEFVLKHDAVICARLETALMLMLQELHEADRKKEVFIGHGVDPSAMIESATKQDELKRWHEATFHDHDALSKQILESTRTNSMVPLREKP